MLLARKTPASAAATEYRKLLVEYRRSQLRLTAENVKRLEGVFDNAVKEIRAQVRKGASGNIQEQFLNESGYYQTLLSNLEGTLQGLRGDFASLLTAGMADLAQNAAYREAEVSRLAGVEADGGLAANITQSFVLSDGVTISVRFGQVALSAVERCASRVYSDGWKLSDRLYKLDGSIRKTIEDTLVQGVAEQISAAKLANRLTERLSAAGSANPRYDAMRIARTEINTAHREAHILSTIDPATGRMKDWILGVRWLLSASHGKIDICDVYAEDDGAGLGDGVYLPADVPSSHAHCFPAGTMVMTPPVEASTMRWYEGEIVEIETVGGNLLTVTPNHPILTPQGWIAAGLLEEGGYVVRCVDGEAVLSLIDPDNDHIPSQIQDVAKTLHASDCVATRTVPVTTEDFHGDGVNGGVCIVRTNCLLRNGVDTELKKPFPEQEFMRRNSELLLLAGLRNFAFMGDGIATATTGGLCAGNASRPIFSGERAQSRADAICHGPQFDATREQSVRHGRSGTSESRCNALDALARQIGGCNDIGVEVGSRVGVVGEQCAAAGLSMHLPMQFPRLGEGAKRDATGNESVTKRRVSDTEISGECVDRLAGLIAPDRILSVKRSFFAAHVYNLQTTGNWYIANNIIAHNCMCATTTVLAEHPDWQWTSKEPQTEEVPESQAEYYANKFEDPAARRWLEKRA